MVSTVYYWPIDARAETIPRFSIVGWTVSGGPPRLLVPARRPASPSRRSHRGAATPVCDLGNLPAPLRRYVLAVSVGGPLAAIIVAAPGPFRFGRAGPAGATLLVALAAIADRFTIQ